MIVLYLDTLDSWGGVARCLRRRLARTKLGIELRCRPDGNLEGQSDVEVLIPTNSVVDEDVFRTLLRLRLVQQAGAGVEKISIDAARDHKVPVANVPTDVSGAAGAVAEHALGLMLALSRRHRDFAEALRRRQMGTPVGTSLFGRTVGIIGLGAIGRRLVELLEPFNVSIVAITERGIRPAAIKEHVLWVRPASDLFLLLREAEIIVLACPLKPSTVRLLGRNELRLCRRGVCIINVARGPLLDSAAALEALQEGHISSLGLDVFDPEPPNPLSPLLAHENTLASPHLASATSGVVEVTARIMANNIVRAAQGHAPRHEVFTC